MPRSPLRSADGGPQSPSSARTELHGRGRRHQALRDRFQQASGEALHLYASGKWRPRCIGPSRRTRRCRGGAPGRDAGRPCFGAPGVLDAAGSFTNGAWGVLLHSSAAKRLDLSGGGRACHRGGRAELPGLALGSSTELPGAAPTCESLQTRWPLEASLSPRGPTATPGSP